MSLLHLNHVMAKKTTNMMIANGILIYALEDKFIITFFFFTSNKVQWAVSRKPLIKLDLLSNVEITTKRSWK